MPWEGLGPRSLYAYMPMTLAFHHGLYSEASSREVGMLLDVLARAASTLASHDVQI